MNTQENDQIILNADKHKDEQKVMFLSKYTILTSWLPANLNSVKALGLKDISSHPSPSPIEAGQHSWAASCLPSFDTSCEIQQ